MALYFYFNETTGDLVYSDQATYDVEGYVSLGQQTNMNPNSVSRWIFYSKRSAIVTVSRDESTVEKISGLTSMIYMFSGYNSLTNVDLSGFDTSAVTDMSNMFDSCNSLTNVDLSGFDTSAVTDMSNMFDSCNSLTSLDLSSFDTSAVTSMGHMFSGCNSLTNLDLSNFDTSAVASMNYMFRYCSSLTNLDLSSFDTSAVAGMSYMFSDCTRLTSLNLSGFDTPADVGKDYMFSDCTNLRIIDISPNMSDVLSALPADTYYDAITRQSYTKDTIPGGSTYVRDLDDLDLVATMVQTRMGINKVKGMLNEVRDLKKQVDASLQQIQSLQDSLSHFQFVRSAEVTGGNVLDMGDMSGNSFYILFVRSLNGSEDVYLPYMYLIYVRTNFARFQLIGNPPANASASMATGNFMITYDTTAHWAKGWLFKVS